MIRCKYCGNEIKHSSRLMLAEFCREECFWSFEDAKKIEPIDPELNEEDAFYFDMIKSKVKKSKMFVISNVTLSSYLGVKAFGKFLFDNKLMVVKHDNALSVIKKSII